MQYATLSPKIRSVIRALVVVLAIIVIPTGIYVWQHREVSRLSSDVIAHEADVERLESDIRVLQDRNEGATADNGVARKVRGNERVTLANGSVTFTIPSSWEMADPTRYTTHCGGGGSKAGAVVCRDIAEILPTELNDSDPESRYSLTASVFENGSELAAKKWYEEMYGGRKESEQSCRECFPKIHEPREWTDEGYSAYTLVVQSDIATSIDPGDHAQVVYVFARDQQAVVVQSRVVYSVGDDVYDNREYIDEVREFAESVAFND